MTDISVVLNMKLPRFTNGYLATFEIILEIIVFSPSLIQIWKTGLNVTGIYDEL